MTQVKRIITIGVLAVMLMLSASVYAQELGTPDVPPPTDRPSDIDLFTAGIAEQPVETAPCGCKTTFQRTKPTVRP